MREWIVGGPVSVADTRWMLGGRDAGISVRLVVPPPRFGEEVVGEEVGEVGRGRSRRRDPKQ